MGAASEALLARLVGGAGEETIIARVGEGVVTTIGSADTHKKVLENPDLISKTVLGKGLDAGTAFEILSVDIADVDVGENIGAKLQADQAEADMRVARAKGTLPPTVVRPTNSNPGQGKAIRIAMASSTPGSVSMMSLRVLDMLP